MAQENASDTSRPNAGRMYDYWLGGHHNFEIDRQAAEQVLKLVPAVRQGALMQRWALRDIAAELTQKRGYDLIVDFASGLPTQDHLHHVVRPGTTVIYSDYDPVTVQYSRQILEDTPNVYYYLADARAPEEFLGRPEVKAVIGERRDYAVSFWGVSGFLSDTELEHAMSALYNLAGTRTCVAFNAQFVVAKPDDPAVAGTLELYRKIGTPLRLRSLEQYTQLVQPWRPEKQGWISLIDWHGLDVSKMPDWSRDSFGDVGYGSYLVK